MAVWNILRGIYLICTGLLGAQDLCLPAARAQVREVTANIRLTEQSAFSPQGLLQSSHFLDAFSLLDITIFPIRNKNAVLWYYSFGQRYTHQCPRPRPHGFQKVSSWRMGMACCIWMNPKHSALCTEAKRAGGRRAFSAKLSVPRFWKLGSTSRFSRILPSGVFMGCNSVFQFSVNAAHSLKRPAVWMSFSCLSTILGQGLPPGPPPPATTPPAVSSVTEPNNFTALYLRTFCIYSQNTVYHLYNLFVYKFVFIVQLTCFSTWIRLSWIRMESIMTFSHQHPWTWFSLRSNAFRK